MSTNGAITWTNETRKLRDLVPRDHNPREIHEAEADRLGESLRLFGQIQTIAIDPSDGILDGHQRRLVWSVLPTVGPDYEVDVRVSSRTLTEQERQQLVIYLHRGTNAAWNWDELGNSFEVSDLLDWGFSEDELQLNWGSDEPTPDPGAQVDKAAELQEKWGVKRGDVFEIPSLSVPGKAHRVMCGDSTDEGDVGRLMGGERAGAVVTDPPYGQNQEGVPGDEPEHLNALIRGVVPLFPLDEGIVVAFQSPRTFPVWLDVIREYGFHLERALWLYKEAQEAFPWRGWILKSEMILVASIGNGRWNEHKPYAHDCYKVSEVSFRTEGVGAVQPHGSIKPITVVSDIVSRVSPPSGGVFDGLCGSGTTLVACEQTGRIGFGMEIEPKYVSVSLERLAGMSLKPRLVDQ